MSFFDTANFDANAIQPAGDRSPLPEGRYSVLVTEVVEKRTKAGTGSYLAITMQVIGGPHESRKLWQNINLRNPNQTAEEIGKKELSAFCRATGVMQPRSTSDFVGKTCAVNVGLEKRQDGTVGNKVASWVYGTSEAAPAAEAPKADAASKKPW